MDCVEKIKEIVILLDEVDEEYEMFPAKQSELDSKISDIYHYIEDNTMKSKNSYRIIKELKEILLKRKELKKEQSVLTVFQNNKNKLNISNNRKILLTEVCKENKNWDKPYKYRTYDEDEFKHKMED